MKDGRIFFFYSNMCGCFAAYSIFVCQRFQIACLQEFLILITVALDSDTFIAILLFFRINEKGICSLVSTKTGLFTVIFLMVVLNKVYDADIKLNQIVELPQINNEIQKERITAIRNLENERVNKLNQDIEKAENRANSNIKKAQIRRRALFSARNSKTFHNHQHGNQGRRNPLSA